LRRHDGRAEAALIALFGAQQLQGTAAPADLFVLDVLDVLQKRES
jgi:hypothetical protein